MNDEGIEPPSLRWADIPPNRADSVPTGKPFDTVPANECFNH